MASIEIEAAISDIVFNYPAPVEEIQTLLAALGYDYTIDELEAIAAERV